MHGLVKGFLGKPGPGDCAGQPVSRQVLRAPALGGRCPVSARARDTAGLPLALGARLTAMRIAFGAAEALTGLRRVLPRLERAGTRKLRVISWARQSLSIALPTPATRCGRTERRRMGPSKPNCSPDRRRWALPGTSGSTPAFNCIARRRCSPKPTLPISMNVLDRSSNATRLRGTRQWLIMTGAAVMHWGWPIRVAVTILVRLRRHMR